VATKKCSKCGETKRLTKFNKREASKDGLTAQCTLCLNTKAMQIRAARTDTTRGYNLKQRFNMSINEYNVIFLKQKGKCAICGRAETIRDVKGNIKWLSVDHNHDTGAIRGLLCQSCNTGIGKLGDSVKVLKSAIKYLNKRGSYGKK
tara:strand:- start:51 stop:491 length:441 start_codon:yes stop_codon:yes gene_type:complete